MGWGGTSHRWDAGTEAGAIRWMGAGTCYVALVIRPGGLVSGTRISGDGWMDLGFSRDMGDVRTHFVIYGLGSEENPCPSEKDVCDTRWEMHAGGLG